MSSPVTAPFDLSLRHLRAVSAMAARGSMSAAAESVSLSQPALTQGLAKLEAQLATRLFERQSGGMRPTPEGELAAIRVDAAFDRLADAARAATRGGVRRYGRPELLMTATQLRAFLAVADGGSFVAAAAATALSQPAIHRAVRDIEQLCGVPLVERRGRGVSLTPAGTRLARGARLARTELAALITEVAPTSDTTGSVVIGAMPLCRALVLPAAIARLTREMPGVTVDVVEGSWRELVDPLRDGVLDLMVGALREAPPPECVQKPLFTDRLAVIGRAGHPLVGTGQPSLYDLAAFPWIVGQPGTPLRLQWEDLFAGGVRPHAPIECGSVMVIRGVLAETDFLTLLSPDQVALEVDSGLLVAVGTTLERSVRTIGITTRQNWRPTVAQRRLIELFGDASDAADFRKSDSR